VFVSRAEDSLARRRVRYVTLCHLVSSRECDEGSLFQPELWLERDPSLRSG